jgi:hypothetical protein
LQRPTAPLLFAGAMLLGAMVFVLQAQWRTFSEAAWTVVLVPSAQSWSYFFRFSSFLLESWWSTVGWAKYAPPGWWIMTAFLVTAAAAVGLVRRLARARDTDMHGLVAIAMVILSVQMLAEYWLYFRLGFMAQGRHLFPALVPTLVLFWLGVEGWVPARHRQSAALSVVVIFAFLDFFVWTFVAVPVYASTW